MPDVVAVKTGGAGALLITVPKLNVRGEFEENEDLKKCFDAIKRFSDFAGILEESREVRAQSE